MRYQKINYLIFLSDFGNNSPYPAICKGVILNINPAINIIDLTHSVSQYNPIEANFILKNSFLYFPVPSIFLAIVDPEVGSKRKGIIVKAFNRFFVGPDNGMFSFIEEKYIETIISIENKSYFLPAISNTFHARDIFAPVSAHLSNGIPVENFGPELKKMRKIKLPDPVYKNNTIYGKIIYIDSFGNLVSNIEKKHIEKYFSSCQKLTVFLENCSFSIPYKKTYSEVKIGNPVALLNSFNLLEIAVNGGNAQKYFQKGTGTIVKVK